MSNPYHRPAHDNISQRAVASYGRALAELPPGASVAHRDLHAFLSALYAAMYADPASFGMPTTADDYLQSHDEGSKRVQEVTRKLARPRKAISQALTLLLELGQRGRLRDGALYLDAEAHRELRRSNPRVKATLLSAMAEASLLELREHGDGLTVRSALPAGDARAA